MTKDRSNIKRGMILQSVRGYDDMHIRLTHMCDNSAGRRYAKLRKQLEVAEYILEVLRK